MKRKVLHRFRDAANALWQSLRGASGEYAYESHLRHALKRGEAPLNRRDFYLENARRKYQRPNRCC